MKISVFGLGYVGCVSAACLASRGVQVTGVDINEAKVNAINSGRSPIVEPGIEDLISKAVCEGTLRATTDSTRAVNESDISFVCVGTPGKSNGSLDLTHVKRVCQQIGVALESAKRFHIVALRSTLLPGTTQELLVPQLEVYSGKREGLDFGVAVNPEFLREGTAIYDFDHPPFTLVGAANEDTIGPLQKLYGGVKAPFIAGDLKEIEAVKYACNSFHALKVTFANEFGNILKRLGLDSHRVMEIFCRDNKLNLSPYYLKPGFAFGGSCLPKDLRALTFKAREMDVDVPVLNAIMTSNRLQVERAIDLVLDTGRRSVGVLGLSFKPGTDDLRESPMIALIEALIGKGLSLSIYDREVELSRIFGANKDYLERVIPHISKLLKPSMDTVIQDSEVIVIGKQQEEFLSLSDNLNNGRIIIDLVRLFDRAGGKKSYEGICW
ncbi:MAG TPA: UDP-glucose/GDP-mannose dehydrogenase family protein [Blastocatellia bacterium]|nr:UDP-glucose/GDP-mannose dehydrogenase family protein [Blastocatellia bacterium]